MNKHKKGNRHNVKLKPLTPEQWELFESCRALAYGIAYKFARTPLGRRLGDDADCCQEALVALCRAVTTYIPGLAKLSTYATVVIQDRLRKAACWDGMIGLPKSPQQCRLLPATQAKLNAAFGPVEIEGELQIEAPGRPTDDQAADAELVRLALAGLPPREAEVLWLYFGLEWDMAEIGEKFGISRERVRQLIDRGGRKILRRRRLAKEKAAA